MAASKRRIPEQVRQQVRQRAHGRCEYCLLHEDDAAFPHEADHVTAEKHAGETSVENLAWACGACNRFKGTDLASTDPATGKAVLLFNPRRQQWRRHFRLNGARIEGVTASGRATARLLHLNDTVRVDVRMGLIGLGRYPRE